MPESLLFGTLLFLFFIYFIHAFVTSNLTARRWRCKSYFKNEIFGSQGSPNLEFDTLIQSNVVTKYYIWIIYSTILIL